jgi:glycosyltransferase involved in cell wall biosynthesis
MSLLIFHPSVAVFVQQAARSLHEARQLDRFITTVRDDPTSLRQRGFCTLGRIVGRDLGSQFRRRAVTEIPLEKVECHPWGELLRLATGAVDRDGRLTDFVWERTETGFDRLVARRLHAGLTGVYGFEYSSLATFRRARALGLRVIYDVPAPEPRFVQTLLDAEIEKFPELRTPYHRYTARREEARIARRHAEWDAADLVVAASTFTRDSFARAGIDIAKVRIVPYGAPPAVDESAAASGGSSTGPVQLLWAGTFSVRKGAHYLLDAWRRHNLGQIARLRVFGAVMLPDELLHPLPKGIELGGSIPRSELMAHYQSSDALVFPTLCDGFGMVVTEAWSRGLPVLTTQSAGAADLLRDHENGMLFPQRDPEALASMVAWCSEHRTELRAMRSAARATAAGWQWSDYRAALRAALSPLLPATND